jgi:hypothetical protein
MTSQQPLATRAFIYIRNSGRKNDELEKVKNSLVKYADDMGIRVLDTFVDDQEIGQVRAVPAFDRLLDALWRNDGVLLVLDNPSQLSPDPIVQRSLQARIDETSAIGLYVQHGLLK